VADGGDGTDTVGLLGNYVLTLAAGSLTGIERLAVYSSGGTGTNSYSLTTVDANVAAGQQLMVAGLSLLAAESLVFNGQAESDGSFNIRGGRGADSLTGGLGGDQLYGNRGADILKGGGGNDMFEYTAVEDSTLLARDTILDFSAGDRINLIGIDPDGNAANGDGRFVWIGSAAFSQVAGQLRAYQADGLWIVEGDADGNGVADLVIGVTVVPGHMLGAADFWF
jgi:Ca2+-binding RTX toxin-like protein